MWMESSIVGFGVGGGMSSFSGGYLQEATKQGCGDREQPAQREFQCHQHTSVTFR